MSESQSAPQGYNSRKHSLQGAAHSQKDNCMQHTDNEWFAAVCPYMSAEMNTPPPPTRVHHTIKFQFIPFLNLFSSTLISSSTVTALFYHPVIQRRSFPVDFFLEFINPMKGVCVCGGGVGVAFSKGNILRQNKVSPSVRYRERYSWIHACGWSDVPSPSANEPFWVQLYF